jgi:hypothetical protein
VNAPPAISDPLFTPAIPSASSTVTAMVSRRMTKPKVPAVPGSIRRKKVGPAARPTIRASVQPMASRSTTAPHWMPISVVVFGCWLLTGGSPKMPRRSA